jgi:hypothetical protein
MNVFGLQLKPVFIAICALLVPAASLGFLALASQGEMTMLSEKDLVLEWHEMEPEAENPIFYLNYLPVSATYYSSGRALKTDGAGSGLPEASFWLAVHKREGDASHWDCELRLNPNRGLFDLYYCQELSQE